MGPVFTFQREEGMIQGQLNHSDSSQYIRELKDQIDELKAEVSPSPPSLRLRHLLICLLAFQEGKPAIPSGDMLGSLPTLC